MSQTWEDMVMTVFNWVMRVINSIINAGDDGLGWG